jgi:hypothetical protein
VDAGIERYDALKLDSGGSARSVIKARTVHLWR